MKQYRYETSMEPMISRLPSMFAYLEFNEDWTTTLHPASDSFDGSWGKVVENIALPCGVNLCTYILSEEPVPYLWDATNTFSEETEIENKYSINSSEYIRRVEKYEYQEMVSSDENEYSTSSEFVELDELPTEVDKDSPDYVKVPLKDKNGNYALDCDNNKIYQYYEKITLYTFFKKFCFLTEGGTYSYRTLIDYYYRYKDSLSPENEFIKFMEKGIGKITVGKKMLHLENEVDYPNVPDYVYLGHVKKLLEKYKKYHRICTFYKKWYIDRGETNDRLEKQCNFYESAGGDVFLKYLERLMKKVNDVASEYLCYAEHREKDAQINLNIPLFQSKNDLGYLSCYINPFIPGEHYRHGELVTYEGRTYICILNRFLPGGNNYEYVLCNGELFKLGANIYDKMPVGNVLTPSLPLSIYNGYTYIIYGGEYYMWQTDAYKPLDVTEYCTGRWNDNLEINEFDSQHFVLLSEYIDGNANTLSIPQKTFFTENDEWYYEDNTKGKRFKIFVSVPHIPQKFIYPNIKKGNTFFVWDKELQMYVPDSTNAGYYTIEGQTSSQLRSLRQYAQYMSDSDVVQEPPITEDWLFYYKIGNCKIGDSITWDEVNNIKRFTGTPISVGQYVTDLMAYGTIITDISCDYTEKTLTFIYVVNAHLKAKLKDMVLDDDGNTLYKYERFEYDENDESGVVFTETYNYSDPDIDLLVENGDFRAFVENRTEDIQNYNQKYAYKKFVFDTLSSTMRGNIGGYEYEYPYVKSEYTEIVENELDYIYQPLFKKDYFVGYSYEPTVDTAVSINRGNGASYEQHIRLSECKTLEDLLALHNGGFYRTTDDGDFVASVNFAL